MHHGRMTRSRRQISSSTLTTRRSGRPGRSGSLIRWSSGAPPRTRSRPNGPNSASGAAAAGDAVNIAGVEGVAAAVITRTSAMTATWATIRRGSTMGCTPGARTRSTGSRDTTIPGSKGRYSGTTTTSRRHPLSSIPRATTQLAIRRSRGPVPSGTRPSVTLVYHRRCRLLFLLFNTTPGHPSCRRLHKNV